MPPRLILNADDFGLTQGINRAVGELHRVGVLTSATLMANGPAFEDAVVTAKALPALGVGCHIVLVDGTPLLPPNEIPTLLGPDGIHFRPTLFAFMHDLFLGRVNEDEIAREALAQVQKLQRAGIDVTHLDTHKHTHIFPLVARPLIELVNKTSIAAIRFPFEPALRKRAKSASIKRRLQLAFLNRYRSSFETLAAQTLTTDGTLGIAETGTLDALTLRELLSALPNGHLYELCCHPGYYDTDLDRTPTRLRATREIEREALFAVIPKILSLPQPPELIHYGKLLQTPHGAP